jgi:hypothetical protein
MNTFIKLLLTLSILFLSVGCQTNNSDKLATTPGGVVIDPDPTSDPGTPTPTPDPNTDPSADPSVEPSIDPEPDDPNISVISVILPVDTATVTLNSAIINIKVTVIDDKNNPYSGGNVKIVYPDDIRNGRDIGFFEESSVAPVNGVATFSYTAPSDLSVDKSDLVFNFYHESNPSEILPFTVKLQPVSGQDVITNFTLATATPKDVTMPIESNKIVSYLVYDENNVQVPDADITSITVTSLNPTIGTLEDNFGHSGNTLTLTTNNASVNVVSYTKTGIIPLEVVAIFDDENGEEQTLTKVFNIIVLSGPPSAISLSYAGTEQIPERAKFVEKWIVTVTDKYTNKVNNNPAISAGLVAGYVQNSAATPTNAGNYLHYVPDTTGSGTINPGIDSSTFTSTSNPFTDVDLINDVLVTFGTGYKYEASGKWDIKTVAAGTLGIEDYSGSVTSDMGFAVGNNQREDPCEIGTKWIANVYAENDNYILEDTGSLALNVEYDYYLVGKSTMLWVNLVGSQDGTLTRLGQTRKITLRGQGIEGDGVHTVPKGGTYTVHIPLMIKNTQEHYRNANFAFNVKTNDKTHEDNKTSTDGDLSTCYESVTVTVTTDSDAAGTVELENTLIHAEF